MKKKRQQLCVCMEESTSEDTVRRWLSILQGEKPQEKATMAVPCSWISSFRTVTIYVLWKPISLWCFLMVPLLRLITMDSFPQEIKAEAVKKRKVCLCFLRTLPSVFVLL
jgi:hypothetical protein